MNVALGAVIIFILLIPPIAFYLSYSSGINAKAGPRFTLTDGLLTSAIFSLFIHTAAITIIGAPVRFDILIKLLGGEIKDIEHKVSNQVIATAIKQFALYNFIILVVCASAGRFLRWLVLKQNWNTGRNELTRLNNRWWYFFNGYQSGIPVYDLVLVDAVVDTKDGTMIYSGFLIDYVCEGETLDRIYFGDAVRRVFKKEDTNANGNILINQAGEPVTIPGEIFSIAYRNIINLNLRFIVLEDDVSYIEDLPQSGEDSVLTQLV